MNYKNKHSKIYEKEYENQFNDFRDEDVEEKERYINQKLSQLPIHQLIKQTKLGEMLWDFNTVSLYPSVMWHENSIYPMIDTSYAYIEHMNDELVEKFNTGNFIEGSANFKIKYYNPKNLIVQHLPVKKREKKIEIIRMRNGYIIDTLTSVDFLEIVKRGGKVFEIYEGVIYREILK